MNKIRFALVAALFAAGVSAAKADTISFFPNAVAGNVSGSLQDSNIFTFTNVTTISGNGAFAGGNFITFPSITFNDTIPGGLTFSDAAFGSFTSTSVNVLSPYTSSGNSASESWTIMGNFVNGTSTQPVYNPATITLSLNQSGLPVGSLSGSWTMSANAAGAVPEPSSIVLVGLGLASVAAARLRRKKSA